MKDIHSYWSLPMDELFRHLDSGVDGISDLKAKSRKNTQTSLPPSPFINDMLLLLRQFSSPLILILILAVVLASVMGEYVNTFIILAIIMLSGLLGFWQERKANRALQKLQAIVQVKTRVKRDGEIINIPAHEVVYGDVVVLSAGDIIPGDCVLITGNDLHVNEAALTGESFPSEKKPGILPEKVHLSERSNTVFQGTSVINGTADVLVVTTGVHTEFGKLADHLEKHYPETAFEKGVRIFGKMIMSVTLILSLIILVLNIFFGKPVTESILFGIALTVGMAPELLPAIITVTLATGARRMADNKVIVKKLSSIQNLGAINILCSDKTGTLTEGKVAVQYMVDGADNYCEKVKTYAFLNAYFETGFTNPLDEAIRNLSEVEIVDYIKLDEVPYDFIRKRLSIVVEFHGRHLLITKGALENILDVCTQAEFATEKNLTIDQAKPQIYKTHQKYGTLGFRTIGLCYKDITGDPVITKEDEMEMTFLGLIVLSDSLKPGMAETISDLKSAGINMKLITGDNALVATYIGSQIGLQVDTILTGSSLRQTSDEALIIKVKEVDIFAEMEPFQKERIVAALRKSGNVVGYLGDGINDVTALKSADVGISAR